MDFGRQVGVENRAKIDPKRHRKSDEKKKVNLGRLGRVLGRFKRQKRSAVARIGALLWPGYPPISLKKGTLHAENLQTLYRSPASGRRHAAGLLRARCGSKAQQSCVPDTALGAWLSGVCDDLMTNQKPVTENIDFWWSGTENQDF